MIYINKQIKYFFISIFFVFLSTTLFSQRNLKYKNVYKTVIEKSKSEAYSLLLVFQKQEPYFPNTYLQLGLIAEQWAKDYDALVERKDVDFFIYNTGLYFGLAKSKIDDKEVRKNQKFYNNIGKFKDLQKIKSDDVDIFLNEKIIANNEYKKNVNIVTKYFNSSIKHYNNCIKIFKGINKKNNKIKDIYLTADDDFIDKLDELENSFDSTLYYLQNYQTSIKNYPIKKYNQEYKLLPIKTYRLQGLTGSDFLLDLIPIWDYGTWIKNLRKLLKSDIYQMKNEINITEKALTKDINRVNQMNDYSYNIERYIIDDKLKYKIGKYDHNSLILDLFTYKDIKLNYLILTKSPLNNFQEINDFPLTQKARYYNTLFKLNYKLDSLSNSYKNRINEYDANKYKDFIETNYNGYLGLKKYYTEETKNIKLSLQTSYENLKQTFINELIPDKNKISFTYKGSVINLEKTTINISNAELKKYYTKAYGKDNNGNYYITGFVKLNSTSIYAFVAKTDKENSIVWLKTFFIDKYSKNYGSFLSVDITGCNLLITAIKDNTIKNSLFEINTEGKQNKKSDLKAGLFPIYFNYDEINETYLIGYKGNSYVNADKNKLQKILLKLYDKTDLSQKWFNKFDIKGNLTDIIKMNNNYFVVMNFVEFKHGNNTLNSKATGSTNSIISIINNNGKVIDVLPLYKTKPYFIKKAIKINSKTINLLGFDGDYTEINTINKSNIGNLNYILLNDKPKMIFNNWN